MSVEHSNFHRRPFHSPKIAEARERLRHSMTSDPESRRMLQHIQAGGATLVVDPEEAYYDFDDTIRKIEIAVKLGMAFIELGGSTDNGEAALVIPKIRKRVDAMDGNTLLVSFPGTSSQVIEGVDGVFSLYMPQFEQFSEQHPEAVEFFCREFLEIIHKGHALNVPVLPVQYILFNGGAKTTVECVTGIDAIPIRDNYDPKEVMRIVNPWIQLGDFVMLEMGSGPERSINLGPLAREVCEQTRVRPIITGGIRSPEVMRAVASEFRTPTVFGSLAERTHPDEFEALLMRLQQAHLGQ